MNDYLLVIRPFPLSMGLDCSQANYDRLTLIPATTKTEGDLELLAVQAPSWRHARARLDSWKGLRRFVVKPTYGRIPQWDVA